VRIQSDLAARKFSHLAFDYDSSTGSLDFQFTRVVKQDGAHVTVSPDSAKDTPQAITQNALAYESYRQKALSVLSLRPGDKLEYEVVSRLKAQPAGQFWIQYSFLTDAVVLDESLEIEVPKSRRVTLKSPRFPYTDVRTSSNSTVYRWKHENRAVPEDESDANIAGQTKTKPADVNLTTFTSWSELGAWYAKLVNINQAISPELRAKGAALTDNRGTDMDKVRAIYEYVSRIPEIDLPFSPVTGANHPAAQVLSQKNATGADKQMLLVALLEASGISAESAFVSSPTFDPDLPSPAQFARFVTILRRDREIVWLDPSSGVAPFEFLPASNRKRSALLIPSGTIVETPADPPFPSTQSVTVDGHVTDLGKLTANIRYQLRGDNEYVLRLAFHRTPEPQWKELAQTILALDGLRGDVIAVKPSDPSNTENPFALEIDYAQPAFIDWSAERTKVPIPLLALGVPDAPKKGDSAIELGSPLRVTAQLQLTFPENFSVRAPAAIGVSRDYGEFDSHYAFAGHVLTAERTLDFKQRSVAPSQSNDYLAFSHAVAADQAQPLLVENPSAALLTVPSDAGASELYETGAAALSSGNTRSAIPLLEQLVKISSNYPQAWTQLGLAYMRARELDQASKAFQKELEINPDDPQVHNYLGLAYEAEHEDDAAIAAFRQQIALDPLDKTAHEALGNVYLSQHEYAQALPELDKAAVLSPDKASLQLSLGDAYLNLAQNDQALAAFDKAVALSPTAAVWNAVARDLADHRFELVKAEKYAEAAANSVTTAQVDIAHVPPELFADEVKLARFWDTLGWIYLQKDNLDAAERYFHSAWLLSPNGEIAFHLARVYEKRGDKNRAVHTYALALIAPNPEPDAQARLTLLLGGNSDIPQLLVRTKAGTPESPVFRVENPSKLTGTADFTIILPPSPTSTIGAHATAVRFIEGKEELRPLADRLRVIDFGPIFPARPTQKLVRTGRLECSATSVECAFKFLPLRSSESAKAE
jgi:tetratricopeptide (TPR) repeat protein